VRELAKQMVQDDVGQTVDQLMAGATFDADGNLENWYLTPLTALYGFIRLYTALYD